MASSVPIVATAITEALTALNAILNVISNLHAQGGLTPDQILASAQAMTAANNQLYATLIASLKAQTPAP